MKHQGYATDSEDEDEDEEEEKSETKSETSFKQKKKQNVLSLIPKTSNTFGSGQGNRLSAF